MRICHTSRTEHVHCKIHTGPGVEWIRFWYIGTLRVKVKIPGNWLP
jgi:hypothetical protein